MTTDIFIVTYEKDKEWLDYCLQAIARYCVGFRQVIVATGSHDAFHIKPVTDKHPTVALVFFDELSNGHAYQNMIKSHADEYSDADYILHVDSDCLFRKTCRPEDFATSDGRPIIHMGRYEQLGNFHPGGVPWKEITENAVGMPVEYEYMQVFPLMYHHSTYAGLRARIEAIHKMNARTYMLIAPPLGKAFHGYSEFNALGAYAHKFEPERYEFIDIEGIRRESPFLKQFWSHAGVQKYQHEIEEILQCQNSEKSLS